MVFSKKLAGRIYPRHSKLLEALNENASFLKWARENERCTAFLARREKGKLLGFYSHVNRLAGGGAGDAGGEGPIDYLEFGVGEGRSLRLWAEINRNRDSRFYGFDSFHGLPEDWEWALGGMPKGAFSTNGRAPSIEDERVKCIAGLFQDSLPSFLTEFSPRNALIVHLDCDLYSSTLYCLTQLDAILQGAAVIFDEFDNLLHEFAAFRDYARSYRRDYKVLARFDYFKKVAIQVGRRY